MKELVFVFFFKGGYTLLIVANCFPPSSFYSGCILECLNRKHQCPCCNHAAVKENTIKNHHLDLLIDIVQKEKQEAASKADIARGEANVRALQDTLNVVGQLIDVPRDQSGNVVREADGTLATGKLRSGARSIVGKSAYNPTNQIPGTEPYNARVALNRLKGRQITDLLGELKSQSRTGATGFGALSDQNYGEFFQPLDPWLATVNPHSYVVEMSFLFGYPGLFLALVFLAVAIWRIFAVRGNRRLLAALFAVSVLFFQMVPSSLFPLDIFFLIVAITGTRSLQNARRPDSRHVSVPSLPVSQVRLP